MRQIPGGFAVANTPPAVRVLPVIEGEPYCRELGFQLDNHNINDITTAIAKKLRHAPHASDTYSCSV